MMDTASQSVGEPVFAAVLAAGLSTRFGSGDVPKQFAVAAGRPLVIHCLCNCLQVASLSRIVLVHRQEHTDCCTDLLMRYGLTDRVETVVSGGTRQDSAAAALAVLPENGLIVLQNAASPATPPKLISACIDQARRHGGAQAYTAALDTIFRAQNGFLEQMLNRDELCYTCDPTVYRLPLLRAALRYAEKNGITDRPTLELVRAIGGQVALVKSDYGNLKVTVPADLATAEAILTAGDQS